MQKLIKKLLEGTNFKGQGIGGRPTSLQPVKEKFSSPAHIAGAFAKRGITSSEFRR